MILFHYLPQVEQPPLPQLPFAQPPEAPEPELWFAMPKKPGKGAGSQLGPKNVRQEPNMKSRCE